MYGFDERVKPQDLLLRAARLICFDGWNPLLPVEAAFEPRFGRFYRPSTIIGALLRARQSLKAAWGALQRASAALYAALGFEYGAGHKAVPLWERSEGRTPEQVERALRRAAYTLAVTA